MSLTLFALWAGPIGTWGFADYAVALVILAGIVAAVAIGVKALGLQVPTWVVQLFWVVVIVFCVVAVIRLLASM